MLRCTCVNYLLYLIKYSGSERELDTGSLKETELVIRKKTLPIYNGFINIGFEVFSKTDQ